jgi:hypothetical protein
MRSTAISLAALSALVALGARFEIARAQGVPTAPAPVYKPTLALSHPAIRGIAPSGDAVSRLMARAERGETRLAPGAGGGYLASVLGALDVPIDSQILVFSKTSVQAARISPSRPRAIYFSDDVMVAHVPGTPGVEAVAIDPARGPIFYALGERPTGAVFTPSETCLKCHHGPNTAGVPGIYVGSVIPGPSGAPLRDDSAIITDHTTPFWERWGGWYVTAARGEPKTRANAVASSPNDPSALVREVPSNVRALHALFDPRPYPAPTSDIVALLVFEHQTQMTNLVTRVAWQARMAAVAAGRPAPGAGAALADDIRDLVDAMLFAGEAPLHAPIAGVSSFATTFRARGPRDPLGRSLRDFDLETRLFRYPLSFLVSSAQFRALPAAVRRDVLDRIKAILTSPPSDARFAHLTREVRTATLEVARATVPDLPPGW